LIFNGCTSVTMPGKLGTDCCFACLLFLVLSSCSTLSVAQSTAGTGSIVGTVSDPTGAVITGAKVTITNLDTRQGIDVATNSSGSFNSGAPCFARAAPRRVPICAVPSCRFPRSRTRRSFVRRARVYSSVNAINSNVTLAQFFPAPPLPRQAANGIVCGAC